MDAAGQIIERAQHLLLTYYKHLHVKGVEVAELRAENVSWSRIASLYPWDIAEWDAAFNRLTRSKPLLAAAHRVQGGSLGAAHPHTASVHRSQLEGDQVADDSAPAKRPSIRPS